MKYTRFILAAALLLAFLLTASVLPASVCAAEPKPVKLTVLHINDTHGRTQTEPHISQLKILSKLGVRLTWC